MKISEQFLRDSVDLAGVSREQLLAKLTAAGLEVEGVEPVAGVFHSVKVAEIVACEQHPDADRLRVCQVNVGAAEALQIVCGAPNARVGLKAPLAMIGAELPGLTIKLGKLRGVPSHGMLCSTTELGLPAINDGLFELPADAPVGADLRDYLNLDDCIIELKMTPNRSDCLSVRGLARELCALFATENRFVDAKPVVATDSAVTEVKLLAPTACPRYLGQRISGIRAAAQTPNWMRERLRRSGLRCIHPVVDIGNFVMLEYGQPMHGFDASKLQGAIEVRMAHAGETLKLLDEQIVTLNEDYLLIADQQNALAVAGVMGGYDSRVTEATTEVFFESAHFSPGSIMGKARGLGLHTDSSHRFERGVDPQLPELALARATQLLLDIAGGRAGPVVRAEKLDAIVHRPTITLRAARIEHLLGMAISSERVEQILNSLGLSCTRTSEDTWEVQASSARFDIAIEADLIEELARVNGYEHIPVKLPSLALEPIQKSETHRPAQDLRRALSARGYQEAITFAFTSSAQASQFGLQGHALKNPLASDIDVMRPSLLINLLQAVSQNLRRQMPRVRLFELGRVFSADGKTESERLAIIASGDANAEQWGTASRAVDFFDLKGDLQALLGNESLECRALQATDPAAQYLHPTRAARAYLRGQEIGVLGQLHPGLLKGFELKSAPMMLEVSLDAISTCGLPQAQAISKFPSTRRDLAIVVPESLCFEQLQQVVKSSLGEGLIDLQCFDVYRGKGLPDEHKSLAISLILQLESRTLADSEIDAKMQAVIAAIGSELGGSIRV